MPAEPLPAHRVTGLVVGAYAASPAHQVWDAAAEEEFFAGIAAIPGVGTVELPWMGSIHPHDDAWLHAHFPRTLGAILTDIPFTMGRIAQRPGYGLASDDAEGRAAAVADVLRLRDEARRFDDAQGRQVVRAVELHSAPREGRGSARALAASLEEVAAAFEDVEVVIEHCDAMNPAFAPEKGFLSLADELDAIERSGTDVGISLNWARSVIETRDPQTAVEHAVQAAERGRLRGFIASGVADTESPFGYAWIDAHLPFAVGEPTPHGEPASLFAAAHVDAVYAAAGVPPWNGAKVGCADPAAAIGDRVTIVAEAVGVVADAVARHRS